jgi:hypothetical protein
MDSKKETALSVQPQQQQQQRLKGNGGVWCDYHKSGTHTYAQCAAEGGAPPPSFFKRNGKANTAQMVSQSSLRQSSTPVAAQLANFDYDSDESALTSYINCKSNNNHFIIDSGASHLMVNSASLLVSFATAGTCQANPNRGWISSCRQCNWDASNWRYDVCKRFASTKTCQQSCLCQCYTLWISVELWYSNTYDNTIKQTAITALLG